MTTDLIDRYVQSMTPAVMMPRKQALPRLETSGHRYIVTQHGLHMEVRRAWIHAILPMADSAVALPFGPGPTKPVIALLCGTLPNRLLAEFATLAQAAMPNEVGAWVIWHEGSGEFKLVPLRSLNASASELQYERPELESGWHLVLDLHSHPVWPASFSKRDDQDDGALGEVKLCGVLGHVSTQPHWAFRLAAGGLFQNLTGGLE